MNPEQFLAKLNNHPQTLEFEDVIKHIEEHYTFTATAFRNGALGNSAEQNQGSCKILAFAKLQNLSPQQTLACFGRYYRDEVLANPGGDNHQNIRNFMHNGWAGIQFDAPALAPRQATS